MSEFDAIVVGSGVSGGWAAKELTEQGLKVLVLERGCSVAHGKDYVTEHTPVWQLPFSGLPNRQEDARDYEIQRQTYAFNESNKHFWNNDRLNPYVINSEAEFSWRRAGVVGGRSLLWNRQVYRWSELDFQANKRDGYGIPWPVGYADIEPWYRHVEDFIGVSGQAENLAHLPDGQFLPPMNMYGVEKTIKHRLAKKLPELTMTIGRTATLTQAHNGRAACHYCGPCDRGCSTGSYFSSQSCTLPAAENTGNLTLLSNHIVVRLLHDDTGKKVSAVEAINEKDGTRVRFSSKLVFLCASTLGSTHILLNSQSKQHPNGLANGSGALGRYLMDHPRYSHTGVMIDNTDEFYVGNRPNGCYIPRFRNLSHDEGQTYLRGYGYQANVVRTDWQMTFNQKGFGKKYKESLRKPGPFWVWVLSGFHECLPYHSNRVSLHPTRKDRFGTPLLNTHFNWGDNEFNMAADSAEFAAKIFRAAGALHYEIEDISTMSIGGGAIHEMGTARMGDDPNTSVLNKFNQCHELENLFVTDGAFMSSSSCVNPSLTYMAFTARACHYAVETLKV